MDWHKTNAFKPSSLYAAHSDGSSLVRSRRAVLVAAATALLSVPAGTAWASAAPATTQISYVSAGHSIQAAIDAARPGTRIVVRPGTYSERLSITTDRISLEGTGATLAPPNASTGQNSCSGLAGLGVEAAICVAGQELTRGELDEHVPITAVGRPVQDVHISGFAVHTAGAGIVVAGADNTSVDHNQIRDVAAFGVLSVASRGSTIRANQLTGRRPDLGFIGICSDDRRAGSTIQNAVSGFLVGICVQTSGTGVVGNLVRGNVYGIFVDAGVGAFVRANLVGGSVAGPAGVDVVLEGAVGTVVRENLVWGTGTGVGILLEDAPDGSVGTGNRIVSNLVSGHTTEVTDLSSGTNQIRGNW